MRAAGYVVVRPFDRQAWIEPGVTPPRYSISPCLSDIVPSDKWLPRWRGASDDDVVPEGAKFGVGPTDVPELIRVFEADFDAGLWTWPHTCLTLDYARTVARRLASSDLRILGFGLPEVELGRLLGLAESRVGTRMLLRHLQAGRTLAPGGRPLGHELVAFEGDLSHSWRCTRSEREVEKREGVVINDAGFIDSEELAVRAALRMTVDELGEPEDYFAWLVVEYPLSERWERRPAELEVP